MTANTATEIVTEIVAVDPNVDPSVVTAGLTPKVEAKPAKGKAKAPAKAAPAKPTKAPAKGKTAKPSKKAAEKRSVGRPKADLKFIMNKSFSLADVVALNPNQCEATVRRRLAELRDGGTFTLLDKKVVTGKRGKPADLFINTKLLTANRANLAKAKDVEAAPVAA